MIALSCPHCGNQKDGIRLGYNRSGTARCRCQSCQKTFTLQPRSRGLTPQKEATIEGALAERIWQVSIARMLRLGRDTIRKVRKKGRSA